ncbi:MAG: phosphate/phosphite/phosphonate ABC transporter substrate-binding protein [Porticoccaceae bacterium]
MCFSATAQVDAQHSFRIGKVSTNPSNQEKHIGPMSGFLADQMGYQEAGTVYTKDIRDMVEKFKRNEVEFFTGSLWEAAVLVSEGVGEPVAIKFKEQSRSYRSLIVVRADSNINSIADLSGKLVAFEDPSSTSGYRVPYLKMRDAGLNLEENIHRPANNSVVHYRFSNSEQISSAWLYSGIVDAICISDSDWAKTDHMPDFQKGEYRVIHASPELPRAIEVVRTNMSTENKQKIRRILLDPTFPFNQQGLLVDYHETSGFAEIDTETLKALENFSQHFAR